MSSAKTERLVNLTMALLASRRFMTKSEIFRRVSGYSGNPETKERMFERDKDDLRALGIEIEVGGHDPLFEDEPGYRILPEKYQLPTSQFTGDELGLISVALDLWRGSATAPVTENVLRRFNSLGITAEHPEGIHLTNLSIDESGLNELATALAGRIAVKFEYQKAHSQETEIREIHPMGLSAWRGSWYLVGEDLKRKDIRAFKVARIKSEIKSYGPSQAYEIPEDFNVRDYLVMYRRSENLSILRARKAQANNLRSRAIESVSIDEDWDELKVPIDDEIELLREILWSTDDLVVVSPEDLREKVISSLEQMVVVYG